MWQFQEILSKIEQDKIKIFQIFGSQNYSITLGGEIVILPSTCLCNKCAQYGVIKCRGGYRQF